MKILYISQYYYPEQFQINDIAPALVNKGHQLTVLCGLPNYPQGKIYPEYRNKKKRKEIIDGVEVIRCWQIARGRNPISLMLNYISFVVSGKKAVKKLNEKFEVVLSYQLSPVTMALPAIQYKKMYNVPLLLYCLDIWPESALAHLKFKKGLLYKVIERISSKIYNKCDKILVTSYPFIQYLHKQNGVPNEKIGYLPQHADTSMLDMDLTADKNEIADFLYAGNLGAGQRIDVLIKAAKVLGQSNKYKLHIVGDGSKRSELEAMVKEYCLEKNVIFYGYQKRADMPAFYKKADVLLISLRGNNAVGNTMPGKLQTYMTTGKPILGAINGAANEIISEAECGKCVASGDYKGLAALMLDYIKHPDEYAHCGENAKRFFKENFTLEKYIEGLESELVKMVNK
jgi:glycosyltransferase involved in cell wall biosynthesis